MSRVSSNGGQDHPPTVGPELQVEYLGAENISLLDLRRASSRRVSNATLQSRPGSATPARYLMTPRGSVAAAGLDLPVRIVVERTASSMGRSRGDSNYSRSVMNANNLSAGGQSKPRVLRRSVSNIRRRAASSSSDEDDVRRRKLAFMNQTRRPSLGNASVPSYSQSQLAADVVSQTTSFMVGDQRTLRPDDIQHEIVVTEFERMGGFWDRLTAIPTARSFKYSSLFVFNQENLFRAVLFNITSSRVFEAIVLVHIFSNCAIMMAADPAEGNRVYEDALDLYFMAVFTLEAVAKIIATGFVLHEYSYLRESWNVFDIIIVILSYVNWLPGVGNLTALRSVRVLRPLKSISAISSLRVVVMSITKSMSSLLNVLVLQFFFLSTFAIGGVQLFKGQFSFRCVGSVDRLPMLPETYCRPGNEPGQSVWGYGCPDDFSCAKVGNSYANLLNFDSYPQAMSLLFAIMTFDGWASHYGQSLQTFGELSFLFFFLFIVFASYVAPSLALAIINDRFITVHDRVALEDADETTFFERLAKRAADAVQINAFEPVLSDASSGAEREDQGLTSRESASGPMVLFSKLQRAVFLFLEGYPKPTCPSEQQEPLPTPYRVALAICILLNAVLLATLHDGQPDWLTTMQMITNRIFTGIFVLDCILKVLGMGFRLYASQFFNIFDLLITVGSLVELAISGSSVAVVFRTFRLFRLVNLFNRFYHIRKILRSLVTAMKETAFLNVLIFLYLIITGLVGMQLFGSSWEDLPVPPEIRASFTDIWGSILIAFQILTLDGWVPILVHAVSTTSFAAVIYFMAAILLGHYVIVNLFKAILIGAFDEEDILEELTRDAVAETVDMEEQHEKFIRTLSYQAMHIRKAKFQALSFLEEEEMFQMSLPFPHSSVPMRSQYGHGHPQTAFTPGAVYEIAEAPREHSVRSHKSSASSISEFEFVDGHRPLRSHSQQGDSGDANVRLQVPEHPFLEYSSNGSRSYSVLEDSHLPLPDLEDTSLICEKCGQRMLPPLPPVTNSCKKTALDLHQRMCEIMRARSLRETVLNAYLSKVRALASKNMPPSPAFVQDMLGEMWSSGLMLGFRSEDFIPNISENSPEQAWAFLEHHLESELKVLALRVGEEIIGRAFTTHAIKCIPALDLGWLNLVRSMSKEIVFNRWFERLMLCLIVASSVIVALDSPRESTVRMREVLRFVDIGFTIVFFLEMVLKLLAQGIYRSGGYFRDPFNWLDFQVAVVSIVSVSVDQVTFGFLKVLRVFRALRPLRLITRNRSLQTVVLTLFKSTKGVLSVCCIVLLNLTVFGILGLHLFYGSFDKCTDPAVLTQSNCSGVYVIDPFSNATATRRWISSSRNFNNIGNSMLTLFEVSTLEWWPEVMWDCVDSVGHGDAPQRDRNVWYTFFFLLFIILSSFIFMQLFVAVMMSSFLKVQASLGGLSFVTPEQRMWGEAQRILLRYRPSPVMYPLDNPISKRLFTFVNSQFVELFLYFLVCLNVGLMCVDYLGRPVRVNEVWAILNDTMSGFFTSKFVLLFPALGPRYFLDPWNRLDFFLTASTITNICLRETTSIDVSILQVFYIFRLLRVLRIMRRFKGIRVLFEVVLYSLGALLNVGLLMLVLMFLFAVIGMQVFYHVDSGLVIDSESTNFFNFWNSFRLMFRMVTLEDWNKVMHDCMVRPPFCDPSLDNCGTEAAPLFFVLYVVLAVYILSNLLTVSVLDNFNTASQMERSELHFNDIQRFLTLWSSRDKNASLLLDTRHFLFLVSRLRPPMGFVRQTTRTGFLNLCSRYNIPDRGGRIHFLETLIPMARFTLGVDMPPNLMRLQERAWKDADDSISTLPLIRLLDGSVATIAHYFACVEIQSAYRRIVAVRKVAGMRLVKARVHGASVQKSSRLDLAAEANSTKLGSAPTVAMGSTLVRPPHEILDRLQDIWQSSEDEGPVADVSVAPLNPDSTCTFVTPVDVVIGRNPKLFAGIMPNSPSASEVGRLIGQSETFCESRVPNFDNDTGNGTVCFDDNPAETPAVEDQQSSRVLSVTTADDLLKDKQHKC